ncbi:nucleic acid-binding protein [Streptomyces sp. NPDC058614]|uniref:nucleic acid-binding protein n=1 Tax=Streptomyces sp. NPDC058614 TaxID=3346557 RepID=UPI0036500BF8
MTTYDYPDDLLQLQQDLNTARAELSALLKRLPYSVEPMEAWQRPEGHWLAASPARPDSPGWTGQEQQDVAALREQERGLSAAIVTHVFWSEVAAPERTDARSNLKHALTAAPDGGKRAA